MVRVGVLMVAICALAGPLSADEAEGRKHFDAAVAAYDRGTQEYALADFERAKADFKVAVDEYKLSYRHAPHAATLFALGQAYRALGDHEHALHAYNEYLKQAPNGKYATDAQRLMPDLEQQLAQSRATQAKPPHDVPATPEPERSPIGTAKLPVDAGNETPGRSSPTQTTIVLTPQPKAAPRTPIHKRAWFWGVVGGAAAAVALGVGLGVGLTQSSTNWPSQNTTLGAFRW